MKGPSKDIPPKFMSNFSATTMLDLVHTINVTYFLHLYQSRTLESWVSASQVNGKSQICHSLLQVYKLEVHQIHPNFDESQRVTTQTTNILPRGPASHNGSCTLAILSLFSHHLRKKKKKKKEREEIQRKRKQKSRSLSANPSHGEAMRLERHLRWNTGPGYSSGWVASPLGAPASAPFYGVRMGGGGWTGGPAKA